MFNKAIIVFLACQMALAIAAPAVTASLKGEPNVQNLIDELQRSHVATTGQKDQQTDTLVEDPILNLSEDKQLKEFMKDPNFIQQLKEFLQQFLYMYNQISNVQKGTTTSKVDEENFDVQDLLRNPTFVTILNNFFNEQNQQGGLDAFFTQLYNQSRRPQLQPPQVTITHIDTSNSDTPVVNESNQNVHSSTKPDVDVRFDTFQPEFSITHVGSEDNVHQGSNAVSTSEELINQLHSHEAIADNWDPNFTNPQKVTPTVIYHRVPANSVYSEDWAKIHPGSEENSPDFVQQAKNAKYQFASQIDDHINGNYQQRAEIRQNGVLYGKYSYDDGNRWRTVYYEADSNGYRVTKEEVLPTHMKQLTGEASVQTLVDGNLVDYHINERNIASKRRSSPLSQ